MVNGTLSTRSKNSVVSPTLYLQLRPRPLLHQSLLSLLLRQGQPNHHPHQLVGATAVFRFINGFQLKQKLQVA